MRLKEITISGFRGFKDKQTLILNKDIILVKGLNGSGKSSFVEALEWLFFDEIARRKKSQCRSEYSGEFLRNLHCDKGQETFVEVLADIQGTERRLKKKLLSPEKKEYYIDDSLVDDFSTLGVNFAEVYKPVLAQVEIKHYVETDPKDRWEETNSILGLSALSEFRSALQELLNSKNKEVPYLSSRKIIYGLESDLKGFSELQDLSDEMIKRPFQQRHFKKELAKKIAATYSLKAAPIKELGQRIDEEFIRFAKQDKNFEAIKILVAPDREIATYPSKIVDNINQVFNSFGRLGSVDIELPRFLEMGKRLIKHSTCPFCLEETLTDEKLRQIDDRIAQTQNLLKFLTELSNQLTDVKRLKDEMVARIRTTYDNSVLRQFMEKISKEPEYKHDTEKIKGVMKKVESANMMVTSIETYLDQFLDKAERIIKGLTKFEKATLLPGIVALKKTVTETEQTLVELREEYQSLLNVIVTKTPSLSDREKAELSKALLFRKIIDHLNDIKYVGIYENNLGEISRLVEKVENFEKIKSGKLLTHLSKQIRDFYSKLNPSEKIQFSEIVPTKGKSRRIQIKATSYGLAINPVSCFSESHMNCLCLSIYFSQRVLNNPYWKFVLLDDPVQSMDEDHGKNLIRILAQIAQEKQVIVLSHNNKFCQDFRDLFYGVDYLFYEFSSYSQNGPRIELKQAPFDTYMGIARKYQNGNMEERANAANNLRKAIERFTIDALVHKASLGFRKASEMKLDERLDKIETSKLLTLKEIGEIRGVLNVCDPGSHEPPKREVTPNELCDGIATMETLAMKYLK